MEAEEALRFTQLLLDRAGEGAFWTDPDGRFLYVNEAACSMLGYSREELLALSVPDTLPPEQGSLFQELSAKVRARGPLTFEVIHVRKGGERFPAEVTLSHLEYKGRECYCAFARDVTGRKRAEAALRASEERYHGLFEGVPVGLYRTTPAGRMLDANSALVRTLGFRDLEALLETQVGDLYLDPEDRRRWQRAFEGAGAGAELRGARAPPPGRRGHLGALHRARRPRRRRGRSSTTRGRWRTSPTAGAPRRPCGRARSASARWSRTPRT